MTSLMPPGVGQTLLSLFTPAPFCWQKFCFSPNGLDHLPSFTQCLTRNLPALCVLRQGLSHSFFVGITFSVAGV